MAAIIDKLRSDRDDLQAERDSLVALTEELQNRIDNAEQRRGAVVAAIAKIDEAVDVLSGTDSPGGLSDGSSANGSSAATKPKAKKTSKKTKGSAKKKPSGRSRKASSRKRRKAESPPSPDALVAGLEKLGGTATSQEVASHFGLSDGRTLSGLRAKAKADDRYEASGSEWKLTGSASSGSKKSG